MKIINDFHFDVYVKCKLIDTHRRVNDVISVLFKTVSMTEGIINVFKNFPNQKALTACDAVA